MLRQFANKFYHLWSLISTGRPRALVPGATDIVGGRRCDNSGLENVYLGGGRKRWAQANGASHLKLLLPDSRRACACPLRDGIVPHMRTRARKGCPTQAQASLRPRQVHTGELPGGGPWCPACRAVPQSARDPEQVSAARRASEKLCACEHAHMCPHMQAHTCSHM